MHFHLRQRGIANVANAAFFSLGFKEGTPERAAVVFAMGIVSGHGQQNFVTAATRNAGCRCTYPPSSGLDPGSYYTPYQGTTTTVNDPLRVDGLPLPSDSVIHRKNTWNYRHDSCYLRYSDTLSRIHLPCTGALVLVQITSTAVVDLRTVTNYSMFTDNGWFTCPTKALHLARENRGQ